MESPAARRARRQSDVQEDVAKGVTTVTALKNDDKTQAALNNDDNNTRETFS